MSLACLTALLLVSPLIFDFEGFCVWLQWGYTLVMMCKVFTFHALQIKHWRTQTHLGSNYGLCDHFHVGGHPIHVCVSLQILNVSAVVLANLCVSHIMTSNNAQVSC